MVVISYMKMYKVTEKGQVTLPVEVRESLGIDSQSMLEVWTEGDEVRMRKVDPRDALGPSDPIWELIGVGRSGTRDVSVNHDRYLAEGELRKWRESSRTPARSTRSSIRATATTRGRSHS
jgi:AbrB family looped-hinge helix DNA binding protein